MRYLHLIFIVFCLFPVHLFAQTPTIITIDNQKIGSSEFERLFLKNRTEKTKITENEIDEYLNLFINFKLKVKEAEDLGFDTLTSFKNELKSYRDQLTKPYFFNGNLLDSLVLEAYNRLQWEIDASHILIKLSESAPPVDTLRAYEKAMSIRDKLLTGQSFEELAVTFSDDPSSTRNKGHLGYFTALQMIYPFENVAYTLPIDSISYPVRTKFGYHLIQVHQRRPARGKVKVAHIMKLTPKNASILEKQKAKQQIDSIYNLLINGQDFKKLAQEFSDDHSSGANGGELPWFSSGKMIKDFEDQAFALKSIGDFSKPFQTNFGWHIVLLLDKKGIAPFEETKEMLYSKVKKDSRSNLTKQSVIDKLKKEYNFQDFNNLDIIYQNVDTTMFLGNWTNENIPSKENLMFTFEGHSYSIGEFTHFLELNQPRKAYSSAALLPYLEHQYNTYIENKLFDYENSQLEKKYPEFANLVKEYHDGILLFDLSEQEIWNKSSKDSVGLRNYYEKNKKKYIESAKTDVSIFSYSSQKLNKKWKRLEANFDLSKIQNNEDILLITQIYDPEIKLDTSGLFEINDPLIKNSGLAANQFSKIGRFLFSQNEKKFYYTIKFVPEKVQSYKKIRGQLLADYQKQVEDKWINELKEKHSISVNNTEYKKLKNKLLLAN